MKFIPPQPKQPTEKEIEDHINNLIEKANEKGETYLRTYGPNKIFANGKLYASEHTYPKIVKITLAELRKAGYKAEIMADDSTAFCDIYLKIEW